MTNPSSRGPRGSAILLSEDLEASPRQSAQLDTSNRQSEPEMSRVERFAVPIVFVLFVVMRAMDRVFNKRVSDRMKDYQLLYINVLWPIGIQLMTIMMVVAYIFYQRHNGDMRYTWRFLLPGSAMASGVGAVAMWRLGLFSIFDQVNASLTSLPAPFIDVTSQNIMQNMVIVWTVLISMWYLSTRYSQVHFIASVLVVLSGLVSVTVEVQTHEGLGEYKAANGQTLSSSPLWYFIFLIGTIPAGISNCYKQKMLKKFDLEVMYATLWSGNFQILWGFLFFPMNWIPLPNLTTNTPQDTPGYFRDGWTCFTGHSPIENDPDNVCASAGGSAATWFMVYLIFNLSFNVLLLWLTKRMSATWAAIATVLCQDLSSLFSMSKAIMGDEAQPVTYEQYLGLIIAGIAMWVYNLEPEIQAPFEHGDDGSKTPTGSGLSRESLILAPSFCSDRTPLGGSFATGPMQSSFMWSGRESWNIEKFDKHPRRTFG